MTVDERFDLDAYLVRIGYAGPRSPTAEALSALHVAHLGAIPFENVDVLLRRPIGLDLESLQAKLVGRRRGGYCFEQNTLFAVALRQIGFDVATLEARVRPPGVAKVLPRTHMVLAVMVDGRRLLADVGFGGDGPLKPVDLSGAESEQPGARYRVVHDGRLRALQLNHGDAWQDLYAFTLDPALPVDFEVANHYTSTHPSSPFTTRLTAQLSLPEERRILRGREVTVRRSDGSVETSTVSDADLLRFLEERIGIELPPATRLPSAVTS